MAHDKEEIYYVGLTVPAGDPKEPSLLRSNANPPGWALATGLPWSNHRTLQAWQYLFDARGRPYGKLSVVVSTGPKPGAKSP